MLSSGDIFSIPYYDKGAAFTGSQRDFRFRVEAAVPDNNQSEALPGDGQTKKLKLTIYPDKLCYDMTNPGDMREFFFDYSSEGLELVIDTINNTEAFN